MGLLRDITVLITAAGNVFMPGTTECIRKNGERHIRLIGADMNDDPTMLEMFDAYYPVPRGDAPEYVDVLLDICKKEKVDVVLPIMSVELEALSANKARFAEIGTRVSVSELEALRIANDKKLLFDYLTDNGLPCAKYNMAYSLNDLETAVKSMGYPKLPVCIKVTNKSGSRGFRILDATVSKYDIFMNQKPTSCYTTLHDILCMFEEVEVFPEIMVMEYLSGSEYTVDLLTDKGRVLYSCCRRSTNMENSIMLDGVVENNKSVLDICAGVTEKLRLDGNIGFDVKERSDGTPLIMECNPRITAGIPVSKAAGVNLPYLCVKKILGEELPDISIKSGTIMKRRWREMFS